MASIDLIYHRLPDRTDRFQQTILYDSGDLLVTEQVLQVSSPLVLEGEDVLQTGDRALWCMIAGAYYDIGIIYKEEGGFSGYYCDIILPMRRDGMTVTITDLCLDVWITRDGRPILMDEDEFQVACDHHWIAVEVAAKARQTTASILSAVEAGRFPPRDLAAVARKASGMYRSEEGARDVIRSWHQQPIPAVQWPSQ